MFYLYCREINWKIKWYFSKEWYFTHRIVFTTLWEHNEGWVSFKAQWQVDNESRLPFWTSSSSRLLHSVRKMLAPVRLPSPPHTHRLVMPFFTRLKAAAILPSRVVKALHRALPITVPPCSRDVISQVRSQIKTHSAQHSAICHWIIPI